MVVTFEEQYLQDLYEKGETKEKKHRYQPNIIRGYQKGIKFMIQAKKPDELKKDTLAEFEFVILPICRTTINKEYGYNKRD